MSVQMWRSRQNASTSGSVRLRRCLVCDIPPPLWSDQQDHPTAGDRPRAVPGRLRRGGGGEGGQVRNGPVTQ
ncbi:hypothetical protein GCM10009678_37170 [Actinomadura kijaniata]